MKTLNNSHEELKVITFIYIPEMLLRKLHFKSQVYRLIFIISQNVLTYEITNNKRKHKRAQ